MAGTNPDENPVVDDDLDVSEEGLAALKADNPEVDPPDEGEDDPEEVDDDAEDDPDAGDDPDQIEEEAIEEDADPEEEQPSFVKEFPQIKGDTPEEYAKNLEIAYKNSTAEVMRIKGTANAPETTLPAEQPAGEEEQPKPVTTIDPVALYAKQQLDKEIGAAYDTFRKDYTQVEDPEMYKVFTEEVKIMSKTILDSQGRLAPADELYRKAAISLGWEKQSEPDDKEKLAMALKNKGASPRASGTSKSVSKQPKISQKEIEMNRKMYPGKTDAEIIKELTPYHS